MAAFSSRDILLQSAAGLTLGNTGVNMAATRDVDLTIGAGQGMTLNGSVDVRGGREVNLRTNLMGQSTAGRLTISAYNDLNLIPLTTSTGNTAPGSTLVTS